MKAEATARKPPAMELRHSCCMFRFCCCYILGPPQPERSSENFQTAGLLYASSSFRGPIIEERATHAIARESSRSRSRSRSRPNTHTYTPLDWFRDSSPGTGYVSRLEKGVVPAIV